MPRTATLIALILVAGWCLALTPAAAVSIELKDAAPDRIERQRAAAEGRLKLPDAPDVSRLPQRLAEKGLKIGDPVFIRIFKAQSELEIWMEKDGTYVLFDTYPICHWSGTLGPKLRQGDKQAPEGFYTVSSRQLHRFGRWPGSLDLGFPNAFDKLQSRSGSYILVHGGCSSAGCFAMTNGLIGEIYKLAAASLEKGPRHVPVHVFPFRMTQENLDKYQDSPWREFWLNLKEGHDAFERTGRPPRVSVCSGRYQVHDQAAAAEIAKSTPLGVCRETASLLEGLDKMQQLVPADTMRTILAGARTGFGLTASLAAPGLSALAYDRLPVTGANFNTPRRMAGASARARATTCSPALPSCRRHMALQARMSHRAQMAADRINKRRMKTAESQ